MRKARCSKIMRTSWLERGKKKPKKRRNKQSSSALLRVKQRSEALLILLDSIIAAPVVQDNEALSCYNLESS